MLDIEAAADLPPIRIFAGPFGTGKTEVAINYALTLARLDQAVTLTDLDVVAPYFRSREMRLGLLTSAPVFRREFSSTSLMV